MDTSRVEGLVIGEMDYGDTSKILHIFTRSMGKISVMVKGARKKGSKNLAMSRLFAHGYFDLNRGKSFYYLKEAALEESNSFATESMDLVGGAGLVCEILDKIMPEGLAEEEVFDLSLAFFKGLKEDKDKLDLRLISYLVKLASFLGFQPDFTSCLICRKAAAGFYSPDFYSGGFVCSDCRGKGPNAVSREDFRLLNHLLYLPSSSIKDLDVGDRSEPRKLLDLALNYIKISFDIDKLNSEHWLRRINFL